MLTQLVDSKIMWLRFYPDVKSRSVSQNCEQNVADGQSVFKCSVSFQSLINRTSIPVRQCLSVDKKLAQYMYQNVKRVCWSHTVSNSGAPCSCPSRFTQMDCDGHLAQCLSEVNVDVTW